MIWDYLVICAAIIVILAFALVVGLACIYRRWIWSVRNDVSELDDLLEEEPEDVDDEACLVFVNGVLLMPEEDYAWEFDNPDTDHIRFETPLSQRDVVQIVCGRDREAYRAAEQFGPNTWLTFEDDRLVRLNPTEATAALFDDDDGEEEDEGDLATLELPFSPQLSVGNVLDVAHGRYSILRIQHVNGSSRVTLQPLHEEPSPGKSHKVVEVKEVKTFWARLQDEIDVDDGV